MNAHKTYVGQDARRQSFRRRLAFVPVLLSVLAGGAQSPRAEIHTGVALIHPGLSWDFSGSVAVFPPDGDLRWITIAATSSMAHQEPGAFPYFFITDYPAQIAFAASDSTYEELSTAPSDSTLYGQMAEIFTDAVYVVRTKENHFAKLVVKLLGGGMTIIYTYQDNGTRILVNPVGVESTTWGKVKSLYSR